jgi:hypothetical protein
LPDLVIFHSNRFRFVARILAMLLLAWTSADLCGHGVCSHDREPIAPWVSTAPGAGSTSVRAPGAPRPDTTTDDGPDDCFCCCHCIDVRMPFELPVSTSFVALLGAGPVSLPFSAPAQLDHPPLA